MIGLIFVSIQVAGKLIFLWEERASLSVLSFKWIVQKIKDTFSKSRLSNHVSRQNVTKERGKVKDRTVSPTDRSRRQSTQSASTAAQKKKPRSRKGVVFKNMPKRAQKALEIRDKLFEIGVKDSKQPPKSLQFLIDQVHGGRY